MQSALMFSINYSTAKTLLRMHRFNLFPFDLSKNRDREEGIVETGSLVRCGYVAVVKGSARAEDKLMECPSFFLKRDTGEERSVRLNKMEIVTSVLSN